MIPMFMKGQTYSAIWKQVKEAEQKDLPQSAEKALGQIVKKAEQERNYSSAEDSHHQQGRSFLGELAQICHSQRPYSRPHQRAG